MTTKTRVLIVEDEQITALDLQQTLESLNYDVVGMADNGLDAIALANTLTPQVVLMDIMLKGDMSGLEAGQAVGLMGIPVIYLTALRDQATIEQATDTLGYGFLNKPFRAAEISAAINMAVRKAAKEQQLKISAQWNAAITRGVNENVEEGIIIVDKEAHIQHLNRAAEQLTGWLLSEAKYKSVFEIVQAEPPLTDSLLCVLQQNIPMEVERIQLQSRQGTITPVDYLVTPINDDNETVLGFVLVLHDVSEQIKHERRCLQSEAHFNQLFEYSVLGTLIVSLDGYIQRANRVFGSLLGYKNADDIVGVSLAVVSNQEEQEIEQGYLLELYRGEMPSAYLKKSFKSCKHDNWTWTFVHISLLRDKTGKPEGYLYQIHEFSEQLQAV